jgi:hypothetical protein
MNARDNATPQNNSHNILAAADDVLKSMAIITQQQIHQQKPTSVSTNPRPKTPDLGEAFSDHFALEIKKEASHLEQKNKSNTNTKKINWDGWEHQ